MVHAALALIVLVIVGACSGGDGAAPLDEEEPAASAPKEQQLLFFAGTGEETKPIRVRPDPKLWSAGDQNSGGEKTKTLSLPTMSADSVQIASGVVSASVLVKAALLECGVALDQVATEEFGDRTTFYYLKGLLSAPSCDRFSEGLQALVCAADHLQELSESNGPIVWNMASAEADNERLPRGPYTFPPPDANARFLVRDIALRTLAHVAWLDMLPRTGADTGNTCTDLYAQAVTRAGRVALEPLFGIQAFNAQTLTTLPKLPSGTVTDAADVAKLAGNRLTFKAHLLRAAARMIPDLVSDSVYADLSGALQRGAAQGDLARGLKAMWGNAPEGY
jgi:hypothetical protein